MYVLTKLTLHNICQKYDYTTTLSPGLSCVLGPNGSGKTSLLRALVYGLTGLVDGLWGNQQTLQKDGTADPGFVIVGFTDGTKEYEIKRFSTSSINFPDIVTCGGQTVALRRKSVDAFMETIFGISCQLMFQVCWGRQGELSQLLTAPASVINTFLAQVFDTRFLEKLRAKIKTKIDNIVNLPSSCIQFLEDANKKLAQLPKQDELEKAVARAREAQDKNEQERARCREMVSYGQSQEAIDARRQDLKKQMAYWNSMFEAHGGQTTLKSETSFTRGIPREVINKLALDGLVDSEIENMKLKLAACAKIITDNTNSIKECDAAARSFQDKIEALDKEYDNAMTKLKGGAEGRCQVCHGVIADKELYWSNVCKMVTGFTSVEGYKKHTNALVDQYKKQREAYAAQVAKLQDEITTAKLNEQQNTKYLQQYTNISNLFAAKNAKAMIGKLKEAIQKLDEIPVIPIDVTEKLSAIENTCKQGEATLHECETAAAVNKATIEATAKRIKELASDVKQYNINKEASDVFITLRDVFSQNRAQARYLKSKLNALNKELARFVTLTGMPYSLRLDEDSHIFMYVTESGYEHVAAHLSGAQKSMSAVALQMALFSVMRPNMNLYLIDEPTESLDDTNKEIMASMFNKMNTMLESISGTMLIVTRDKPIVESSRYTIEV